jgi:putative SOS response-associated peptidase YedK
MAIKPETYPGYLAPIMLKKQDGSSFECLPAMFGMVPHWAEIKHARHTYNSRSETVAVKSTFKNAWKHGQFCIVLLSHFYEPNYESGKAVRWKIMHKSGRPFGVAGIWERKVKGNPDGSDLYSFSMLTINADDHILIKRFHESGHEKRMIVILEPDQYEDWLSANPEEAKTFLNQYPAELMAAEPSPVPPRKKPAAK